MGEGQAKRRFEEEEPCSRGREPQRLQGSLSQSQYRYNLLHCSHLGSQVFSQRGLLAFLERLYHRG